MVCPGWFRGFDCFFELIGSLVLLMLGIYSLQIKKISSGKRPHLFFLAFVLVSLSYLVRIFKNINLYYPITKSFSFLGINFTYESYKIIPLVEPVTFVSRCLFLVGLFLLFFLFTKSREKQHLPFMLYMLIVFTYLVSFNQVLFYLTTALLFAHIAVFYCKNSEKCKTRFQRIMLSAFIILAASQVLFLLSSFLHTLYAPAAMVQFIGFLLLLFDFVMLVKTR
ncbi:MAG TPA: hypothetical protein ENN46_02690 [Candidatus Woesearchaeota archaeon]|nr:hypothetical protein [Candidatus Woesearchaeota archaeon]